MINRLIITAIAVFMTACAATYQPTNESLQLRSSMTNEDAISTLHTAFKPSDRSLGICAYGSRLPLQNPGDKLKFFSDGFEYHGEKQGKKIGTESRYGEEKNVYETKEDVKRYPYSELSKIRVTRLTRGFLDIPPCGGETKGDYMITLILSLTTMAGVDTPAEDLDKVIAALQVVSPNIEILEGAGF